MKRTTTVIFAVLLVSAMSIGAVAAPPIIATSTQFTTGGLDVLAPVDGVREVAGPNTTAVTISTPNGTFTNSDPLFIDVVVFIHDADGVSQVTQTFLNVTAPFTSDAAGAMPVTNLDFTSGLLGGGALSVAILTARNLVSFGITVTGGDVATDFGIGIVVNDVTLDGHDGADTLLDLDDESLDMVLEADDMGPELIRVFRDSMIGAESMVFVFDDNISGSAVANLTNVDFESSPTVNGAFAALTGAAFPGNPTIIPGSEGRSMRFNVAAGQENLAPPIGQFLRVALSGTPAQNVDLIDIAGNPTDMQPVILVEALNGADLNGDGSVNGADLAALLTQWGTAGSADLNNDGVVNGADLAILLINWTG